MGPVRVLMTELGLLGRPVRSMQGVVVMTPGWLEQRGRSTREGQVLVLETKREGHQLERLRVETDQVLVPRPEAKPGLELEMVMR